MCNALSNVDDRPTAEDQEDQFSFLQSNGQVLSLTVLPVALWSLTSLGEGFCGT
jgi:hypothetical protein